MQNSKEKNPVRKMKEKEIKKGKGQFKEKENVKKKSPIKGDNDLKWYSNYPELLDGLITPNFNRLLSNYEYLAVKKGYVNPGDMRTISDVAGIDVRLMDGAEREDDMAAIINRIRASVRRANSGATNGITNKEYFKYIHNYRILVALYSIGRWAYGTINHFRSTDTLKPWSLFAAKDLDYVSFSNNAANLRAKLNWVRNLLKVYAPLNLDLYRRTEWMFSNNFTDSNDIKAQIYTFALRNWLQFDSASSDTPTEHSIVSGISATSTGLDYLNYLSALDSAISAFTNPDYTALLAGDILKAFGAENLHALPYIDENYSVESVYSEEVLTQIQNATVLFGNNGINTHTLVFSTDGNVSESYNIAPNASLTVNSALIDSVNDTYINMYKNNITALDVLAASRLQCKLVSGSTGYDVTAFGTELVMDVRFIYKTSVGTTFKGLYATTISNASVINPNSGLNTDLPTFWAVFDWMPRIVLRYEYYGPSSASLTTKVSTQMWDINNYGKFETVQQLYDIQIIAIMSLYHSKLLVKTNTNVVEVK